MDAAMNALGEPTRRRILELLVGEERTVGEIAQEFDVTRPAISQHLRVLEQAELVTVRPEGTRRWYTADAEGLQRLRHYVDQLWAESLGDLKLAAERQEWPERTRARLRSGPSGRPDEADASDRTEGAAQSDG